MHSSKVAICLMDSDKAIGGLYLDADDFHRGFFLSLVELPVREKRENLLPVFHWLTANHISCLSPYETDCLHFPPNKFSIKAPGKLKERRNQRKENKLSTPGFLVSLKAQKHECGENLLQNVSLLWALYHPEALLPLIHTKPGQMGRLTAYLIPSVWHFFT